MKHKEKKPFVIPGNYPFKEDLEAHRKQYKESSRSITVERITVTESNPYNAVGLLHAKLFQRKAVLDDLTSAACRILITICCKLEYEGLTVDLRWRDSGLSRNTFYKGITELMFSRIISKVEGKKNMYWVNVSTVVIGDPQRGQIKLMSDGK